MRSENIEVILPEGKSSVVKEFIREKGITIVHWHGMPYGYGDEHNVCMDILQFCRENHIFLVETSPFSVYQKDMDDLVDIKLCVSHTSLRKLFYRYRELRGLLDKYGYLYNPLDTKHLEPYKLTQSDRLARRREL